MWKFWSLVFITIKFMNSTIPDFTHLTLFPNNLFNLTRGNCFRFDFPPIYWKLDTHENKRNSSLQTSSLFIKIRWKSEAHVGLKLTFIQNMCLSFAPKDV